MPREDGRQQWAGYLPAEVLQAMREAEEPMWKVVTRSVKMAEGLGEASTEAGFRRRLDELESELDRLDQEIDERLERREDVQERYNHVEEQLERFLEQREEYGSRLDAILDAMEDQGSTVFGQMEQLREAARQEYGTDTRETRDEVVADLKQRALEQDRPIESGRFTDTPVAQAKAEVASADGDGEPQFRTLQEGDE